LTEKHLHIISFDVPFPADYGGVIDVFFKIKALHAQGLKVHLHCYHYGRKEAQELDEFCEEVFYYPRNMNRTLLIHPMPFIVVSRQQDALLGNLLKDDYPILFEGKHTTYYIDHPDLANRRKFVRTHNVEEDYYRGLAKSEKNPLKQWYYRKESKKLAIHRPRLTNAEHIFCISQRDTERFGEVNESCSFVPPFHANDEPVYVGEKEPYCLYHGNLAVAENIDAAMFLIKEVFVTKDIPLVIFGSGAPKRLIKEVSKHSMVSLEKGGQLELEMLVRKAQLQVLPTFQSTGMKLKLLYSLFNGGHILVTPQMVIGTGAEHLVTVAEDVASFNKEVSLLMNTPFSKAAFLERKNQLNKLFSNEKQAKHIVERIFYSATPCN
jgi:hypothetical protein